MRTVYILTLHLINRENNKLIRRFIVSSDKDYMFLASIYAVPFIKSGYRLTYAEVEEHSEDDIPFT